MEEYYGNDLILTKLLLIEYEAIKKKELNQDKLKAIKDLRAALLKIDFLAESVPLENYKKLSRLLISLKGEDLSKTEIELVKELIE